MVNNLNGLYGKYIVIKTDGTPVYDRCFVLKPDKDPVAVKALQAYAFATDDDQLREDLYAWVGKPAVEAETVSHGEWVECMTYDEDGYYDIDYKCSECGRYEPLKQPYCHCGAKMDGGKEE